MEAKFSAFIKNGSWTLVPRTNDMHVINSKCVFRIKYKPYGILDEYKARLVAKGFQQTPRIDFFDTFNPVIKALRIRVVFTLAVTYG